MQSPEVVIAKGLFPDSGQTHGKGLQSPDQPLRWHAPEGSDLPDSDTEPDASLPLRFMLRLLGPLAPDSLL